MMYLTIVGFVVTISTIKIFVVMVGVGRDGCELPSTQSHHKKFLLMVMVTEICEHQQPPSTTTKIFVLTQRRLMMMEVVVVIKSVTKNFVVV